MPSRETRHPTKMPPLQPAVSIAYAKANFSSLISTVESDHQPVTISRRGIPVAVVVPFPGAQRPRLSGSMAGTARELGDIVSPLGIEWTLDELEIDGSNT